MAFLVKWRRVACRVFSVLKVRLYLAALSIAAISDSAVGQVTVPFRYEEQIIRLDVRLAEKERSFLLALGQPDHIGGVSLRPLLGDPLDNSVVRDAGNATGQGTMFLTPNLRIGKLVLSRDANFVCVDFSRQMSSSHLDVDGILGTPALKRYRVELDFDSEYVRFWENDVTALLMTHAAAVKSRFPWNVNGVPTIGRIEVGSHVVRDLALQSTSNGQLIVESRIFATLERDGAIENVRMTPVAAAFADHSIRSGIAKNVRVAGWRLPPVVIQEGKSNAIGFPLMARFWWLFDVDNGVIYIDKSKRFSDPPLPRRSGIRVHWQDNAWRVQSVDKGDWAEGTKVSKGDVIRSMNGKTVASMALGELVHALRKLRRAGGTLELMKAGGVYTVKVPREKDGM